MVVTMTNAPDSLDGLRSDLGRALTLVDFDRDPSVFLADKHHPNTVGARWYFEKASEAIQQRVTHPLSRLTAT